jgi:phosphotransferase system enzyme I (PtsI)
MPVYPGTAISGKLFIGKVKIYQSKEFIINKKQINQAQIKSELKVLQTGVKKLETEISTYLEDAAITQLDKDILTTHLMIVTDIEITQILELAISRDLLSAPMAVQVSFEKIIRHFENMDNTFYAQRAEDYKDVAHHLLTILIGDKKEAEIQSYPDDIIFLKEVTPSLVSHFAHKGIKAYCTEHGSYTSHSSILSRAFDFTAIVSNSEFFDTLKDGEPAILDAVKGIIIINPDRQQLDEYNQKLNLIIQDNLELKELLDVPTETKHKVAIALKANIEFPEELNNVLANKCAGIGLFRTEFLYLNRQTLPDEDYQTQVYSNILSRMNGLPVTIRTFDLGGDKLSYFQQSTREDNPYLGCRGIRFSLQQIPMFKTQLRAILKASVHGKVNIMFPMIIGVEDFHQAKAIVQECSEELVAEGIEFDKHIPLGVMIETPSAAICSDQLAKECDFFSLGTNDLVQYTLAADRNNDNVKSYYIQHHPSVLLLIQETINAAKRAQIPISICGEMASHLNYVPLLIGMGITELSVSPLQTLPVKAVVRNCDQQLFELIDKFDFNTQLANIDYLLDVTLKPYYTI